MHQSNSQHVHKSTCFNNNNTVSTHIGAIREQSETIVEGNLVQQEYCRTIWL